MMHAHNLHVFLLALSLLVVNRHASRIVRHASQNAEIGSDRAGQVNSVSPGRGNTANDSFYVSKTDEQEPGRKLRMKKQSGLPCLFVDRIQVPKHRQGCAHSVRRHFRVTGRNGLP